MIATAYALHHLTRGPQDQNNANEELKEFFHLYVNGFSGAAKVSAILMQTNTYEEALGYIDTIL